MKIIPLRIVWLSIVPISAGVVWACSGNDSNVGGPPAPTSSGPTDNGSGDAGASTPPSTSGDQDAATTPPPPPPPPPTTCTVLDQFASRLPDLTPATCKTCVASKCCTQMGACYGGAAATGVDGADGTQTTCMLYGACADNCGDDAGCETTCSDKYGDPANNAWNAASDCIATCPDCQ